MVQDFVHPHYEYQPELFFISRNYLDNQPSPWNGVTFGFGSFWSKQTVWVLFWGQSEQGDVRSPEEPWSHSKGSPSWT